MRCILIDWVGCGRLWGHGGKALATFLRTSLRALRNEVLSGAALVTLHGVAIATLWVATAAEVCAGG